MAKKFAVLHLEDSPKWADGGQLLVDALSEAGDEWHVIQVARDGTVPSLSDGYAGVVLTGSRYNLSSPETLELPWIIGLVDFVRAALELPSVGSDCNVGAASTTTPAILRPQIVGICFGAQLLGYALGGRVSTNPGGVFVLKAEDIIPTDAFARLPCARGIVLGDARVRDVSDESGVAPGSELSEALGVSSCLRILVSHGDCVAELPPAATRLAGSSSCTNEMFSVGNNCFGLQSHPEFDADIVKAKIWPVVVETKGRLSASEQEVSLASFTRPRHAKAMLEILRRFLKRVTV